jgi:hypothetical protein
MLYPLTDAHDNSASALQLGIPTVGGQRLRSNDDTMRASTESVHLHAHAGTGRQQAERLYFLGGLIMTLAVRVGSPERIVFVRATHPYV